MALEQHAQLLIFGHPMRNLRAFLFGEQNGSLWRYCLIAFPLAILPSFAFVAIVYLLFDVADVDRSSIMAPDRTATRSQVLGAIVFAPVAETLLLGAGLGALSVLTRRPVVVAGASAMVWGCAHATFGFLWLFGTTWSFFVFSCAYLSWRKVSFHHAFMAAAVPHTLINSTVFLIIAILDA